nr:MAG TPA: hypothetical protein [Caudoviricetes sp.]
MVFRFIIVKAFYPLPLIVSYKPSIHFHPRLTLGIDGCKSISNITV